MKSWISDHVKNGVSLSEYIEICLYNQENGYYERDDIFGRDGDFVTSPMITSIFSDIIALFFVNLWQKYYKNSEKINIIEYGAGNGQDMLNKVKTIDRLGLSSKMNFYIIEKSKKRINQQSKILANFPVSWVNNIEDIKNDNPYFVYGNEILDAFSIDQYHYKNGIYNKLFLRYNNDLETYFDIANDDDIINLKNHIANIPNDSIIEISTECIEFVDNLSKFVQKKSGAMLFFDYGYKKNPFKSTLQALHKHKFVSPFEMYGLCDITHLVNFDIYYNIIKNNMGQNVFVEKQSDFLLSIGIEHLAQKYIESNKSQEGNIKDALNRILFDMKLFYSILSISRV